MNTAITGTRRSTLSPIASRNTPPIRSRNAWVSRAASAPNSSSAWSTGSRIVGGGASSVISSRRARAAFRMLLSSAANRSTPALSAACTSPGLSGGPWSALCTFAERRGETALAGQWTALGAHDGQGQKVAVVASQPRQQSGSEKGRLARARCAEDDEQTLIAGRPHAAKRVESLKDFGIAAEEHRRVLRVERLEAAIWRARFVPFRRPRKIVRAQPGGLQSGVKTTETVGEEWNVAVLPAMNDANCLHGARGPRGNTAATRTSFRWAALQTARPRRQRRKSACSDFSRAGIPPDTTSISPRQARQRREPPRSDRLRGAARPASDRLRSTRGPDRRRGTRRPSRCRPATAGALRPGARCR